MILLKKSDVIQLVAVVKSLLKSQMIKNVKNTVTKILTLLTELFSMSPNTPNKNSLDFLSDYYFNTKSPVAFTSPLALYREAKKGFLPLLFVKLKLGYNPKRPTPFINQFVIIFRETESLVPGLMIIGKQIWWTSVLWHFSTKDTNFIDLHWSILKICLGRTD